MLTEVELNEFKAHAATRVGLERLTVLVGPNASGKTSVLSALHCLSQIFSTPLETVFAGERAPRWLIRQGSTADMRVRVAGISEGEAWEFALTMPRSGELDDAMYRWRIGQSAEGKPRRAKSLINPRGIDRFSGVPSNAFLELRSGAFLRLDAKRLAEPSYSTEEEPRLEEDGYGLATVLSTIKLASTEKFLALEEAARSVVPALRGLGLKRTKIEQRIPRVLTVEGQQVTVQDNHVIMGDELLLDFKDARGLPAHAASEGTLVALGLLAALHGPVCPRLVLLDDIERALHPKAQLDLVKALRAALDTVPDTQIVATTHSPYLVDGLKPEEVVVMAPRGDGAVAAKRLSEHPKAEKLLSVLTTGELWTAEGEDWVNAP